MSLRVDASVLSPINPHPRDKYLSASREPRRESRNSAGRLGVERAVAPDQWCSRNKLHGAGHGEKSRRGSFVRSTDKQEGVRPGGEKQEVDEGDGYPRFVRSKLEPRAPRLKSPAISKTRLRR